jgi:hypothetical protein
MALTYATLRGRIGHKAGYAPSMSTSDFVGNQSTIVERALQAGLSRFYDPPPLPGEREKHLWSFLTPTLTFDLIEGQYSYDLPDSFVAFMSPLAYAPGDNDAYPPIEVTGADTVQKLLGRSDDPGRPIVAGVRVKASHDIHVTAWELVLHPVPDGDYQVKAATKINPTVPGATGDVPLGGQPHENTIIAACIAELVAMLDDLDDGGKSEMRFMEFLRSSVSHDRQVTAAQTMGYNGNPSSDHWKDRLWSECSTIPPILYNGVAY